MAAVQNNEARLRNIKSFDPKVGRVATVRLKPGFNVVDDETWNMVKDDPYTKILLEEKKIVTGKEVKSPKKIVEEHRAMTSIKAKEGKGATGTFKEKAKKAKKGSKTEGNPPEDEDL